MDPDLIDLEPQGHRAELDDLTRPDFLLRDRFIIDEGAVGGLQVANNDAPLVEGDLGVKGGNGSFVDDDVVGRVATDGVQPATEVEPEWHQEATKMVEVHSGTEIRGRDLIFWAARGHTKVLPGFSGDERPRRGLMRMGCTGTVRRGNGALGCLTDVVQGDWLT
jgi:hypothetical protein